MKTVPWDEKQALGELTLNRYAGDMATATANRDAKPRADGDGARRGCPNGRDEMLVMWSGGPCDGCL